MCLQTMYKVSQLDIISYFKNEKVVPEMLSSMLCLEENHTDTNEIDPLNKGVGALS